MKVNGFAFPSDALTLDSALTSTPRHKTFLARGLRKSGLTFGVMMLRKIGRLFVIKNRLEAFVIIYALALGATARGSAYLDKYPGGWGVALFFAATAAVFLAGAAILDSLAAKKELADLKDQLARLQR